MFRMFQSTSLKHKFLVETAVVTGETDKQYLLRGDPEYFYRLHRSVVILFEDTLFVPECGSFNSRQTCEGRHSGYLRPLTDTIVNKLTKEIRCLLNGTFSYRLGKFNSVTIATLGSHRYTYHIIVRSPVYEDGSPLSEVDGFDVGMPSLRFRQLFMKVALAIPSLVNLCVQLVGENITEECEKSIYKAVTTVRSLELPDLLKEKLYIYVSGTLKCCTTRVLEDISLVSRALKAESDAEKDEILGTDIDEIHPDHRDRKFLRLILLMQCDIELWKRYEEKWNNSSGVWLSDHGSFTDRSAC